MPFTQPIAASGGELVISDLHSADYVAGVSGWRIGRDGVAEFSDATVRGTIEGAHIIGGLIETDDSGPRLSLGATTTDPTLIRFHSDVAGGWGGPSDSFITGDNGNGGSFSTPTGRYVMLGSGNTLTNGDWCLAWVDIVGMTILVEKWTVNPAVQRTRDKWQFGLTGLTVIRTDLNSATETYGMRIGPGGLRLGPTLNQVCYLPGAPLEYLGTLTTITGTTAGTATTITGLSQNVTVYSANDIFKVRGYFDVVSTAATPTTFNGCCFVAGTQQTGNATNKTATSGDRNTVSQEWVVTGLTPGSVTFDLRGFSATGSQWAAQTNNSKMIIEPLYAT